MLLNGLSQDILNLLNTFWFIFSHGGWAVFVLLAIYLFYLLYLDEIRTQYKKTIPWVFLEVRPPKVNAQSFYSMEQVFMQLHTLFDNWSFSEKYLEGRVIFWMSMEIISLGGKISYILKVPAKQRSLVESALYANFPSIEITEVEDYLANFDYDPENPAYDIFAAELGLTKDQAFPIRTYKEFQGLKGPEVSDIVVDPLSPLIEAFTKISPHEFYGLQFLICPVMEGSWAEKANEVIKKLKADLEYQNIDEVTRQRISSIQTKLGRPGFEVKMRLMHMGTVDTFTNVKKLLLSPLKIFSTEISNGFKPSFGHKVDYRISQTLEAPYIDYEVKKRKKLLFNGFKNRSMWAGGPYFILNTEELATLFHFPVSAETIHPAVESMQMKQIQPPANLPIE